MLVASCFVKATNCRSKIITPDNPAYVDSSVNSKCWGSILWPPGKVSKVVVKHSNRVWVVLKALIDMGLVTVETTCCHMAITAIERREMGGQWGEGDTAESLSSLKGYCRFGRLTRPTPGLGRHHNHTSGLVKTPLHAGHGGQQHLTR